MGSQFSKEVSRQVQLDRLSDVVYFIRQGIYNWCYLIVMETKWSAQILLSSNRLKKVEFFCVSNLREDAEQRCKALYGVSDVRQLTRIWN